MTQPVSRSKVVSAEEAVSGIASGAGLAVCGAGGVQEPDLLISALVERYRSQGTPKGLTEFHPIRTGELDGRGTSLFGEPGLVDRMIGGSFWPVGMPRLIERINNNEIAAYNLPIGVMYALLDAIGAGRPGVITRTGLDTFVDPEHDGGALNAAASEPLVERLRVAGEDFLFYRAIEIDCAFIRGTAADPAGNISMDEEAAICGPLHLARAAKAGGGTVIAQVKRIVDPGTLDPRRVIVPAPLVDHVVVNPAQMQTTREFFDPTLVGDSRLALDRIPWVPAGPTKVVLRRVLHEIEPGEVVGIGFGLAGFLPAVAIEDGAFDEITFTIEHGLVGGINGLAAGGSTFPVSHNPEAIIDAADQLAWYAGGGLDRACLGIGEMDVAGNVNVSRFGDRIPGCGGFIEMTQGTRQIVFCGTLGDVPERKIVPAVHHLTFNGKKAALDGQRVLYITEKAVFRLTGSGLVLTEIAPGVDLERDLLSRLACKIEVAREVRLMPAGCFS